MHIHTTLESIILAELGQRIKQLRISKGISQTNFSLTCNMEKSSMSKIESGQVNISYLTLVRLSKCLEVSTKELCGN
jgi:transcriptional regulator with XRE-family HTH domain